MKRALPANPILPQNPFPRRDWRPAMTKSQRAVFQQQMNHARPVFHGRSVTFVADVFPPIAPPLPPKPKKPKPYAHVARFFRLAAVVTRRFFSGARRNMLTRLLNFRKFGEWNNNYRSPSKKL